MKGTVSKTIAQQLGVTKFPFTIRDDKGKEIYFERSDRCWYKREWDDNGREIYYERSDGYWIKYEYDDNGNEIYYENSDGIIRDNRPKAVLACPKTLKIDFPKITTLEDVVAILKGMDLTINQYDETIQEKFKPMFDKGLLIEIKN
jgi:hypothetical protein